MELTEGARAFNDWLDSPGVGPTAVAEALHVSRAALRGWRLGEFRPGATEREKIEKLTGGLVRADAWLSAAERMEIDATQALIAVESDAAPAPLRPASERFETLVTVIDGANKRIATTVGEIAAAKAGGQ